MNFQQPHIVWFLFLLIIPLLIHLINFQRTKVLQFPGVYRLKEKLKVAQQQKKLQNWLIWLCRTLALLFLILAFSLPTCNSSDADKGGIDRYILVVDNSLSAKVVGPDGVPFEKMRVELRKFLASVGSNQLVYLIVQSSDEGSGWMPPEEISKIMDTLDCSVQYNGWLQWKNQVEKAVKIGADNFDVQRARTQVMVFTDLEASTARGVARVSEVKSKSEKESRTESAMLSDLKWRLFRFPLWTDIQNISIDSAWSQLNLDSSQVPSVYAQVSNHGKGNASVSIAYKSAGKLLGSKRIELQGNSVAKIDFPLANASVVTTKKPAANEREGQGFIFEKGADAFPWDDRLYAHSTPEWSLRVGVFGTNGSMEKLLSVQKNISIDRISRPVTAEKVRKIQALCVLENTQLTEEERGVIQDFMDAGGVVFQSLNDAPISGAFVLNTPFGGISAINKKEELYVDNDGFSHPVFRGAFSELPGKETSRPLITRRFELKDVGDLIAVLVGDGGEPILFQQNWGKGYYWLWASGLVNGSESWMSSPWVLPVFTELISANNRRNYPLYGVVKLGSIVTVPGFNSVKEGGITMDYLGDDFQRRVAAKSQATWMKEWQQGINGMGGLYLGDQPEWPGFYSVASGEDKRLLALNISRMESGMKRIENEVELFDQLGLSGIQRFDGSEVRQASDKAENSNGWKLFLWLTIVFLALEVAIQWRKNISSKQG